MKELAAQKKRFRSHRLWLALLAGTDLRREFDICTLKGNLACKDNDLVNMSSDSASDSLRSAAFALTAYGSHYSPRDSPANELIAKGRVSARESSALVLQWAFKLQERMKLWDMKRIEDH